MKFRHVFFITFLSSSYLAHSKYLEMNPDQIENALKSPEGLVTSDLLEELNSDDGKILIEKFVGREQLKYQLYFLIRWVKNVENRDILVLSCLKNPGRMSGTGRREEISLAYQLSDSLAEYFPDTKTSQEDYQLLVTAMYFVEGRNEMALIFEKLLETPVAERRSPGPAKEALQAEVNKLLRKYRNADISAETIRMTFPNLSHDERNGTKRPIRNAPETDEPGESTKRPNKKTASTGEMTQRKSIGESPWPIVIAAIFLFMAGITCWRLLLAKR